MDAALAVAGFCAEATAWWMVSRGASVWASVTPTLGAIGVVAVLAGAPPFSSEVDPARALAAGAGSGVALYAATRAFVSLAAPRWALLRRDALAIYERRGGLALAPALALAVAVGVVGEELFWRRLVQLGLAGSLDGLAAAAVTWLAFVVANAPSRNLAIVAGAVVGGAVWAALCWWTGGVGASLASHAVWTGLMIALPAIGVREGAGA
jgi:membrane protease YdiL (CAAX protease family)